MKKVLRSIAAIFLGLFVAFLLLIAVEFFSAVVHPFPKDFGGTPEEICRHVQKYPQGVLTVIVLAWAVTAFVSTWIARSVGNIFSYIIVGLFLQAALVLNIFMLPYPIWFKVANLLVIPAAIAAGSFVGRTSPSMKS